MEPGAYVASTEAVIAVAAFDKGGWRVEVGVDGWGLALGVCAGRLFAGMADGLLRSDDRGLTWYPSGLEGRRVTSIGCGSSAVYAGTKGPLLFRSEDGGDTWVELRTFRTMRRWYW